MNCPCATLPHRHDCPYVNSEATHGVDYFAMTPVVGKWYFWFPSSWRLAGAFDTREEAILAAEEFWSRGTTGPYSPCYVGQYVHVVGRGPETRIVLPHERCQEAKQ